ncbi:hypothetical protein AUC68_05625 [Methyloceanibacter methanicus]|uniref:Capsule synthesis protein CapA domain-containing protein n=1 Tax=Methyloceanibacter methanicus TaxID=1774968 RepID=A0A1E3W0V2_9HYPH|nr:CapA family protein [Methyloceanibacter methanicus]ODR99445.1 hypothetical protein AUC68_05625 [Methyloceanibacter methanicus]
MSKTLPYSPAEAVEITSPELRAALETALKLAKTFGFWDVPYKDAATTFEEMDELDIFYWVHKAANPILRMEDGVAEWLATDASIVALPEGFDKERVITLGAAGDILQVQADGLSYSSEDLYGNVADLLFEQSISFANLESPITTQPLQKEVVSDRGAPVQCCSEGQFEVLKGYGGKTFTALNVANNHMFDFGVEGIETTQSVFAKNGIVDIGTNRSRDDYGRAKIITKDGIRIGFASATFGLNGREMPDDEKYRIHVSRLSSKFVAPELDLVKCQIDDCKTQGCDFIVASLHWGWEFEFFPRKTQVAAAHELVEYGADAILGGHPHVIQPVEYYRTKRDPNRIAVIAYSLGTLTWGFDAPYIALSILLNLSLAKGTLAGADKTYIETATVTPVFRSNVVRSGALETRIEKLSDHLDGASDRHAPKYVAELKRYADLVLGGGAGQGRAPAA